MANSSKGIYEKAKEFKNKYPFTVAWRLKKHAKIAEKHIDDNEEVLYVFTGQKNNEWYNFMDTAIIVVTDKRIMTVTDRVLFGYFMTTITPDMFNDLTINSGLLWGKIILDTIDEEVVISNLSKKALDDIETGITKYVLKNKKKKEK